MSIALDILKAHQVGIRDLKGHASKTFFQDVFVVTMQGKPVSINIPYADILELIDLIDEVTDPQTLALVQEGRKAIKRGIKGIPVSRLFEKARKNHR